MTGVGVLPAAALVVLFAPWDSSSNVCHAHSAALLTFFPSSLWNL